MTKDPVAFRGRDRFRAAWHRGGEPDQQTTRLKEDSARPGVVIFFAVGICLVTMIQRLPTGNKSGSTSFCSAGGRHQWGRCQVDGRSPCSVAGFSCSTRNSW
jgi:hypothetical protein